MTIPTDPRCYQFGPYLVDVRRRLLWRNGVVIPLTLKAFEILLALLENRGRPVDKNELLERVWPKIEVEENTLTRHVSTLRKALDDHRSPHQFIVTVPGRGYRFVADVIELAQVPDALSRSVELAPAEEPQAETGEQRERPATRRISPLAATAAAVLTIAVVIAAVALELRRSSSNPHRTLRQITFHSGVQRNPTWSPDGRSVAYVSDLSGNSDIWVQAIDDPNPVRVTSSPSEDATPDWSPNGEWLVFRSERDGGGLYIVSPRGGVERRIARFGYDPRWSPDGSLVLFSSSGHEGGTAKIYVVGLDITSAPLAVRPDLMRELRSPVVAWAPEGRGISIWAQHASGWTLHTAALDGGPPIRSTVSPNVERRIKEAGLTFDRFTWARSGRYLFFEGQAEHVRNLWRITVDPTTLTWTAGPDRLTTGTGRDGDVALSPDGSRLVFTARQAQTRLWSFPFDAVDGQITGEGQPLTSGAAGEVDADAPLDGSKLVYRAVRGGRQEFWERSIADGRERLLMSSSGWTLTKPQWSPDGAYLAYSRKRSDAAGTRAEAAVLPVSGGQERVLTRPGESGFVPVDWSPDGAWLLGNCRSSRRRPAAICRLAVTDATAAASVQVIASDPRRHLFEPRFSPDQKWISFIAVDVWDAGVSTVFVMPASGGEWRAITDGRTYDDKPHWAPDGRTIYFLSPRRGLVNLWGNRFDGATGMPTGDPFQVTSFESPRRTLCSQLSQMQIAICANRLFLPITEASSELWLLENVDR